MVAVDIFLLGLLALCAILGFWRGFVSEVLAIAAWVIAIILARAFGGALAARMVFVDAALLREIAAFVLILVVTLMASGMIRWALRGLLRAAGLGAADRLLGASFGALKAVVIAMLLVLAGGLTGLSQAPWWREASLTAPLQVAVLATRPWMPAALAKRVRFD